MSITIDSDPSVTTSPEGVARSRKRSARMGLEELSAKLLPHLRIKGSMSESQICIALGIPRCGRGGRDRHPVPPAWLGSALKELVAQGDIEFSEPYQAYRLPGQRRQLAASSQQQVSVRRDPQLATWEPHQWERQKAERRAQQEREQQVLEAQRKAERIAMRRELTAKDQQEQPAVQVEVKPKPKASPGRPKAAKPSNPAPFLGEKARKSLESKIRCLVRSERHCSEDRLNTVLGKTAVEVARVMPDIGWHQFGNRAFLYLKETA